MHFDDAVDTRIDPRRERTRAAVATALATLSARGDAVTVPALVAEAGISRSTFYDNYRGLDDVLIDTLTGVFVAIGRLDLELRAQRSAAETAWGTTATLVAEIAARRALCRAAFTSDAAPTVLARLIDAFADRARPTMAVTAPPGVDPAVAARYVAGGSVTILRDWVLDDDPAPMQRVQAHLIALLPAWMLERP